MSHPLVISLSFLALALCSGCITTTTTRPEKNNTRPGVTVEVYPNQTLKLYGNPIELKTLVKRLIREEQANQGRAVLLEACGDVRRAQLIKLREYLVSKHIPNVVLVTQRNAFSFEGPNPTSTPPPTKTRRIIRR